MNEKKIYLEEILKEYSNICFDDYDDVIIAMKEACRQTLELAAENAQIHIESCMGQKTGDSWVDKQSILDTIEQIS